MNRIICISILGIAGLLAMTLEAQAQWTPYIGYVYPAGGQQGTTVEVRLGGQRIDGTSGAIITGEGVKVELVRFLPKLSNQEMQLIREQQTILKKLAAKNAKKNITDEKMQEYIDRIQDRLDGYVNRPACDALSSIAIVEVTIDTDAKPGPREISLISERGVTNSMPFYIGQVPEVARKPMATCPQPILGNEAFGLRKRPAEEALKEVTLPCTMNGQIAPGEVNFYKFEAHKGQQLVIDVLARQLVPYIADAVPGWFQPVITLCDDSGKELAFVDDFRFKPDPLLRFEVPEDGFYTLSITDAIYRGREDFVYRITVSELPHVTSIFPLGGPASDPGKVEIDGWNIKDAEIFLPPAESAPGIYHITAVRDGKTSNSVPFVIDTLPECVENQSNDDPSVAQKVTLPIIINGRIDQSGDWDVFQIEGSAGQTIVAEVMARRLDSPVDSLLKVTDESGNLIALNDDHDDPESGLNTHHADSYLMFDLPNDGVYYIHMGETAQKGGKEFGYRLRISEPRPDFALRAVPTNRGIRSKGGSACEVYIVRKDGFDEPVKIMYKELPEGFKSWPVTLTPDKEKIRIGLKSEIESTEEPFKVTIVGEAKIGDETIEREAVPAEDRMQAFLWRHLVPAEEMWFLVYDPNYEAPPKRTPPAKEPTDDQSDQTDENAPKPAFTKAQVKGRLKQLQKLYEEYLLTDEFYLEKVAECETVADK